MVASPLTDGLDEFLASLHAGYAGTIIWWFVWAPSPLLVYFGYRLCQKPFSPGAASGGRRKPILFLRSFADDARMSLQEGAGISLQPGGMLPNWAGLGAWVNAFEFDKRGWE